MAMITLTTPFNPNPNPTKAYSLEGNNNMIRDASLSSYLDNTEGSINIIHKIARTGAQKINLGNSHEEEHLYEDDGEIGVFGAEKYFSGGMDEEEEDADKGSMRIPDMSPMKLHLGYIKKEDPQPQVIVQPAQLKSQSGAPSSRSELSWNSQSRLLQSILRNTSQRRTNKTNHGKSFLASLGCNCSCSGKSSVKVDDNVGEISFHTSTTSNALPAKSSTRTATPYPWKGDEMQKKEKFISSVAPHRESGNLPAIKNDFQEGEEFKPRKSLEVFGSPALDKRKNSSFTLERRVTSLPWDTNAISSKADFSEISASSNGVAANNNFETESDASSDLFEIESLTGRVSTYLMRQVSEATSECITPTARYAPSEASIEWSVVTASAADFSAMSDYSEAVTSSPVKTALTAADVSGGGGRGGSVVPGRYRSGISLGCKSQKAVRVAEDAHRMSNRSPRLRRISDESPRAARLRAADSRLIGIDTRNGEHMNAARLVSSSPIPHRPKLLYMD